MEIKYIIFVFDKMVLDSLQATVRAPVNVGIGNLVNSYIVRAAYISLPHPAWPWDKF